MTKYRSHSAAFKRQVAEEFLAGDTLHALSKRHDISRQLVRIWVGKFEAGALDDDVQAADLMQEYEAKIAALERMVGRQALEIELLKWALKHAPRPKSGSISVVTGPPASPSTGGCELVGIVRSTFYDAPSAPLGDEDLVARIGAICDEFECYGYRCVGAALRHQGVVVNGKKLRRLMRENGLQPKQRRRYVITTDSNHAGPIYPDLAKDVVPEQPNQLWVANLTYVAIPGGFVYLAAILDAWSRKVVGYAISRSMDARIAVAALKAAIRNRAPAKGCIQHSDRGSQLTLR